jgi:ribose transport system substrate-binding protein
MKKIFIVLTALLWASGTALAASDSLVIESAADQLAKGPNGEIASPASDVKLTADEIEKVKAGKYKAALLWAGSGEWYNAMTDGAKAAFGEMGIDVVAVSDANFDPAKQATDIETALALKPDIVLTLPVDPTSGTQAYQPIVDAGITLVFADNGVDKYEAGKQYSSIVTGDQFGMGRAAADLAAEAAGGEGEIGMIWYDVDYFVTNNRDNEFERTINSKYPDIKIVSKSGFTEENATEAPAAAMILQNPKIKAIYCSWDVAAEGVLAALRAAGRKDVKVITHDLGATNCLDMVQGGNFYGTICDLPFDIGAAMAKIAAGNLIGKTAQPYYVVGLIKVNKDNLAEAWKRSLNKDLPANISKALDK